MPEALFVDAEPQEIATIIELTQTLGYNISIVHNLHEAQQFSEHTVPDVAIVNADLPDGSGLDLLKLNIWGAGTHFLLITATTELDFILRSLRLKVYDIFPKPVDLAAFSTALNKLSHTRAIDCCPTKQDAQHYGSFGRLVGQSEPMQQLYRLIKRVAPTNATVFISGESGTGKDLVARTLHDYSNRHHQPFIAINCGAITADLIGSELFGHEKGSFTGAQQNHQGYFEQASSGSLFLDELTETNLEFQVKLLRVLETNTIIPVGGKRQIAINTRVIAATNRVPEEAVRAGILREDLYYRLNTFPLTIPPLRERGSDIALLAEFFLAQLNKEHNRYKIILPAALDLLLTWKWPGNVRELKNVIHRAYILANDQIEPRHIFFNPSVSGNDEPLKLIVKIGTPLAQAEQHFITKILQHCGKNTQLAMQLLNVDQRLINKYLKPGS